MRSFYQRYGPCDDVNCQKVAEEDPAHRIVWVQQFFELLGREQPDDVVQFRSCKIC